MDDDASAMKPRQTTNTIAIAGVPSPSLLGNARWWRWSHSDRESWRRKVARAAERAGIGGWFPGGFLVRRVRVDWGKRPHVVSREVNRRLAIELTRALLAAGIDVPSNTLLRIEHEQSGVGGGTVWVTLERAPHV